MGEEIGHYWDKITFLKNSQGKQSNPLGYPLWAGGSLVVRASDSSPEGPGSMPDATKHPPSTHGFPCRNCGGGDRGRVAIYRPIGKFRRAKIVLSPVWCSRLTTGVPLAPSHDEFRGPRSDYARQVALATTTIESSRCGRPRKHRIRVINGEDL
ncbi:hypothetical protein TNCV_1119591 [Trichonephila clavipes]|uniref:Uncharacterized protein n=1 Tax=Trichonephila clavipes TaxID=2585209 RepID=A0A8X6SZ90_TRICX|nr:hypothetical protein TNCV_1119591 [Trichonephila clavipes]